MQRANRPLPSYSRSPGLDLDPIALLVPHSGSPSGEKFARDKLPRSTRKKLINLKLSLEVDTPRSFPFLRVFVFLPPFLNISSIK